MLYRVQALILYSSVVLSNKAGNKLLVLLSSFDVLSTKYISFAAHIDDGQLQNQTKHV